jgi:hypothetical protein
MFAKLNAINVSAIVEKKGVFAYLSWPYAVQQLRLADPEATWEVKRFDGLPYLRTEVGYFVEVAVTVSGVTLSQIHPVLDVRNRPIPEPTSFDINTSIQRCLVKAIALHGLGLYIYAGEDPPQTDAGSPPATSFSTQFLNPEQLRHIERLVAEVGADLGRLLAYFKVPSLQALPAAAYDRVVRALTRRKAA